jgi:hypothetical protein
MLDCFQVIIRFQGMLDVCFQGLDVRSYRFTQTTLELRIFIDFGLFLVFILFQRDVGWVVFIGILDGCGFLRMTD